MILDILERIWRWATVQGLPRGDFGRAVRYMLERWAGLTLRLTTTPPNALRGPVVGCKNHNGARSLRGTLVAAIFYTLCETRA